MITFQQGQGQPLVLLHGWGMNSHVWQPIVPVLAQRFQVIGIDLPGHGANHPLTLGSLENAAQQVAMVLPEKSIVMGWSLGGMIAQTIANTFPDKIAKLVLVASTPKFAADENWVHGVASEVLQTFASNLQTDYLGTVKRFFALQFLNTKTDTAKVNALRETIMTQPSSQAALADGLEILRTADMTKSPVKQPTQWILGRLDKLIPVSLADALPEMGYKHIAVMPSAAHVPFVTHPELFMQPLEAFLNAS